SDLQLLKERELSEPARARSKDRIRNAQDQEFRTQVAQRDQGHPSKDGLEPRYEIRRSRPRDLAAASEPDRPAAFRRGRLGDLGQGLNHETPQIRIQTRQAAGASARRA